MSAPGARGSPGYSHVPMSHPVAIVTTTIYPPGFLRSYADNLHEFGRENEVAIYIAGDRKTPAELEASVAEVHADGIDVQYLSLASQAEILRPFPDLAGI